MLGLDVIAGDLTAVRLMLLHRVSPMWPAAHAKRFRDGWCIVRFVDVKHKQAGGIVDESHPTSSDHALGQLRPAAHVKIPRTEHVLLNTFEQLCLLPSYFIKNMGLIINCVAIGGVKQRVRWHRKTR